MVNFSIIDCYFLSGDVLSDPSIIRTGVFGRYKIADGVSFGVVFTNNPTSSILS